jgi:predicted phage-related endonuclease
MSEWLRARKSGLGGSEIASLLGMNPWLGRLQLWAEKTGQVAPQDLSEVERIEWGNRLESVVIDAYHERTMRLPMADDPVIQHCEEHCTAEWLDHDGEKKLMFKSRRYPFLQATPDGFIQSYSPLPWESHVDIKVQGPGILEIKTTSAFNKDDWKDSVPPYYMAQAQHYMAVTGLKWASFAVLIGGQELRIFDVPADPDMIRAITQVGYRFWTDSVEGGQAPRPSATDGESRVIQELFPEGEEPIKELPRDARQLVKELETIQTKIKQHKSKIEPMLTKEKEIKNALKFMIGPHIGGTIPGTGIVISYKTSYRKGYTVEPKKFRTLRIRKK